MLMGGVGGDRKKAQRAAVSRAHCPRGYAPPPVVGREWWGARAAQAPGTWFVLNAWTRASMAGVGAYSPPCSDAPCFGAQGSGFRVHGSGSMD